MRDAFFILRIALAVLCVGFAACLGRSLARRRIFTTSRHTSPASWAVRTGLAAFALVFRTGVDTLAIGAYAASLLAAAALFLFERRPKKPEEDLVQKMFADE